MMIEQATNEITSDERLCAALVAHLESGFEQVVLAYQHRLYGFALRLAGNAQDAEEIAQDAFVRAFRALATYTPEQTATLRLRPWLYQIALNVFRNRIRVLRPAQVSLDVDDESEQAYLPPLQADSREQPDQALLVAESEHALAASIAALPEHFRIAIVLRHIEGLSYDEMASLLGQPAGTLKAHVHRGAKLLRTALTALETRTAHEMSETRGDERREASKAGHQQAAPCEVG